ncbi:tetratricopeptide repeat protein [Nocardia asiatica]|uniref:tetratricopeptide repeat protein n=1 Tax=Nocardia asiatica TaxID=209252 RepID=UPI003EDFC466
MANQYREQTIKLRRPTAEEESRYRQVQFLIDRGRLSEASVQLNREENGLDTLSHSNHLQQLARAYFDRGDPDAGIKCYEKAIAIRRKHSSILIPGETVHDLIDELACRLYLGYHRFDSAIELLEKELLRAPESGQLWHRLGITQWYAGNYVPSYAAFSTALQHGMLPSEVFHARGQVLAEMGLFDRALPELEQAVQSFYVASCRAYVLFQIGERTEALREFERVKESTPDNAWHFYRWGICLLAQGDRTDARKLLIASQSAIGPPLVPRQSEHITRLLSGINDEA